MNSLDTDQNNLLNAVMNGAQKSIVIAPAGTGKTFCCIKMAQSFTNRKTMKNFQKILILTFSRNARAQIIKELNKIDRDDIIYRHIKISNYHSFFKKYIDAYKPLLGINVKLSIIDEEEFKNDYLNYLTGKKEIIKKFDSNVFEDYIVINDEITKINSQTNIPEAIAEVSLKYIYPYIKETGQICFALFSMLFFDILKKSFELGNSIAHDYPLIILDEYQDTNFYQESILNNFIDKTQTIFLCDPYQMIYGFRGSCPERITSLEERYTELKQFEFKEYYRYKDKTDIIDILNNIREKKEVCYSNLKNGKKYNVKVYSNSMYNARNNQGQLTSMCKQIYFKISSDISKRIKQNKSVAILCRYNDIVDRATRVFFENGYKPMVIADTKEMLQLTKLIKNVLFSTLKIKEILNCFLVIGALCTNQCKFAGEDLNKLNDYKIDKISRKRKGNIKTWYESIFNCLEENKFESKQFCFEKIIECITTENDVNFVRSRFARECFNIETISPQDIDNLFLQKQYINSFSDIIAGIYITTIHQSKGREFDDVYIVDIGTISKDKNLFYVANSRMKEKLNPIYLDFVGSKY